MTIMILVMLVSAMIVGLLGFRNISLGTTALALGASIVQGICTYHALFPLVGLALLLAARSQITIPYGKGAATLGSAFFAVAIGMHFFPGFGNIAFGTTRFGSSTIDYQLGAGIDKWAVGAIIFAFTNSLVFKGTPAKISLSLTVSILTPVILIVLGLILGVPIDPKFGFPVLTFIMLNLVVCTIEEGFYRLLVQERLNSLFPWWVATGIASFVFFATHYSPSASLVSLTIFASAGIFYALTYQLTRSIHAVIGVHWASNTLHILLLQYPLS